MAALRATSAILSREKRCDKRRGCFRRQCFTSQLVYSYAFTGALLAFQDAFMLVVGTRSVPHTHTPPAFWNYMRDILKDLSAAKLILHFSLRVFNGDIIQAETLLLPACVTERKQQCEESRRYMSISLASDLPRARVLYSRKSGARPIIQKIALRSSL